VTTWLLATSVTLAPMRLALMVKIEEAFTVRLYGAVVPGDDVPAWLRFPGSCSGFRVEQVGSRHALGRPNQLLFLLGQVACKGIHAFRKQLEAFTQRLSRVPKSRAKSRNLDIRDFDVPCRAALSAPRKFRSTT